MLQLFRAARWVGFWLLASGFWVSAAAQAPKTYSSSEILQGLRKLNTLGSVLYIAAHPDDENTRLLAYLAQERHVETAYLSLTRGDGGQNLIGPELREQLGVIRTQELLAARRIDGARQFFTRANDFGFSKTAQEALSVWNHQQVLADAVWIIRQQRPDVLITRFPPDPRAGHGHHQASAIIAAEAFDAAGDPKRFPEQLQYVQVWQPKRLYWNTGSFFVKPGENMDGYLKLDAGGYNPLLGQSYGEIAAHSRSQHRSQGMGTAATRGEATEYFQLVKGAPATKDIFDGIDLTWNRVPGGAAIGKQVEEVIRKYDAGNPSASVAGLLKVKNDIRMYITGKPLIQHLRGKSYKELEERYAAHALSKDPVIAASQQFWFTTKQEQTNTLVAACMGLTVEALALASTVTPTQPVEVTIEAINRSALDVQINTIRGPVFQVDTFLNDIGKLTQNKRVILSRQLVLDKLVEPSNPYWLRVAGTTGMYQLPASLLLNTSALRQSRYGGYPRRDTISRQQLIGRPENPAAASVEVQVVINSTEKPAAIGSLGAINLTIPVQYKHTDPVLGELYEPLVVVPPVMVNIPAARAYVFADQQPNQRSAEAKAVPVTLRAGQAGVSGTLTLQVPAGWQTEPASVPFSLKGKDEEQTVTFQLRPLAGAALGRAELRAVATVGGQPYSRGFQQINYPHIPTQTLFPEATAPLVRLQVARGHTRTIGYLMGAGDQVPEALRQLGYAVTLLDANTDLTAERLGRFDAVVLGIRAYNTVEQLKARQPELLRYVENGGTILVQYTVTRGVLLPQIGPYPLTLSNNRITVENTPVTLLKPAVPLLSEPNQLTPADFATGWVQEQGLYYPSAWDGHYQPVIASHDPGEADQQSVILVAPYGKGRYIYTGLSLFRQLPAGVPGAYRVLANLVESGGK